MASFKDLSYNILILLNELEESIIETKVTYPVLFGPNSEDQRGTIIPPPSEMIPLVEKVHQIQPLVVGMVALATNRVDQRVAEDHRRQFALLQVQVLQMLEEVGQRLEEVNQRLESRNQKHMGSRP
ncbi:hypothetical protein DER46DRAFT_513888 [Fusarium sp. MPI-SDFR-AT-0072]|nr:hypothetical protein DER46DRAFT_513888 [Fusarium sp. MPI-SDFR-AT-0072]KAI7765352.1 hypothetical protein LZL87_013531 [Fusarium oxysporum]